MCRGSAGGRRRRRRRRRQALDAQSVENLVSDERPHVSARLPNTGPGSRSILALFLFILWRSERSLDTHQQSIIYIYIYIYIYIFHRSRVCVCVRARKCMLGRLCCVYRDSQGSCDFLDALFDAFTDLRHRKKGLRRFHCSGATKGSLLLCRYVAVYILTQS